jgi:hypothetical protein
LQPENAMLNKLAVLAAGLMIAVPALADRDHRHGWRGCERHHAYCGAIILPPRVIHRAAPVSHRDCARPPVQGQSAPAPLIYIPPQTEAGGRRADESPPRPAPSPGGCT